jgi:hypothetical protein
MSNNEQLMEDAREWFNGMDNNTRNQVVLSLYKMNINVNLHKVRDMLNNQWAEKFKKLEEERCKLMIECEVQQKFIAERLEKFIERRKLEMNFNKEDNEREESFEKEMIEDKVEENENEEETEEENIDDDEEKLIKLCINYIKNNNANFTKTNLENICIENKISLKVVRELGGFKNVKKLALERV